MATGGIVLAAGGLSLFLFRETAPHRATYELDTRLWFLELKLRGHLPHLPWRDVLRRTAWTPSHRYDVARAVDRGDAPCPVLWDTPLGRFWGTEQDGRELDLLSIEQAGGDIYQRRRVRVRKGDVVFDVGAHLGTFTRVALRRGARHVVAFEPNPVNAACFRRTFAPEITTGRVRLVEAAVWHSPGVLAFEFGGSSQMGTVSTSGRRQVQAVTLDQIVDELRLERVDFIKMDIEGAERHALAGARRLLAADRPRLAVCIYHGPDDPDVIPQSIRAANATYRSFTRGSFQAYFH